jgi:hypothetical protein
VSESPSSRFRGGLSKRYAGECVLEHRGGCEGRLHAHHIYPKRILKALAKRHGFDPIEAEADWRNGVFLCTEHHRKVEFGTERFDRGDMPIALEAFERAYEGIEAWWPRIYLRGLDRDEAPVEGVIP